MPTCRFPISSGFNIRAGQTMKPDTFTKFLTFIFDTFPEAEAKRLDCSQSPIFPCDRRDRARLTVNGGHLDFQSYRGGGRRGL